MPTHGSKHECMACGTQWFFGRPELQCDKCGNTPQETEYLQRIAQLQAVVDAVQYKLAEYMSTKDPVAASYAVQLRWLMHDAIKEVE